MAVHHRPTSDPAASLWHVRYTSGASVSPDGFSFAHLVDDGGYPRAVQRSLTGQHGLWVRWVRLAVPGPVVKVRHSPDGQWLACEVAIDAGARHAVCLVRNDPQDPDTWQLGDPGDVHLTLNGWGGSLVAVTHTAEDGTNEPRLIDPVTLEQRPLTRALLTTLVDSWAGHCLIRVGPRGYQRLEMLRPDGSREPLLPEDHGATTMTGFFADPARARQAGLDTDPAGQDPERLRVLACTDTHGDRQRLVEVVVGPDGVGDHRVLAEREGQDLDEFVVSLDAGTVALLWNRQGVSELQIMSLDGQGADRHLPLPGLVARELSLSGDGSLLGVTVEGPGMPPSVQLVDTRTGRWGPVEPALLAIDRAYAPTRLEFEASDGLTLSGWLHRPADADGPGPTVLYFHGGPEAEERPGFSYLFPPLVDAGFTVFAANVRGSTGAGRAFSHADERELRPRGIEDVADCVRFLVGAGIADPSRIGVSGRSYGGYLTMVALTWFPRLFAGGVAICGMSDLRTFYRDTEPWIAQAAVPKYGDPATDTDLLTALSPITRIDALRTPILLAHGENDTNVPVTESTRFFAAAKERRVRSELLLFDDEGHEIVTQENHAALAAAMIRWFGLTLNGVRR